MSEIKPTPGPWAVARMTPCRVDTASGSISISWSSNNDSGAREREAEANARLIAEAGTVFHTTGMTPMQLVERVKQLEGALQAIVTAADSPLAEGGEMWFAEAVAPPVDDARAALAKCQGLKP